MKSSRSITAALVVVFAFTCGSLSYNPAVYRSPRVLYQTGNYLSAPAQMTSMTMTQPCTAFVAQECQNFCSTYDPRNVTCMTLSLSPFKSGRIDCSCDQRSMMNIFRPADFSTSFYDQTSSQNNGYSNVSYKQCNPQTYNTCKQFCQTYHGNPYNPVCAAGIGQYDGQRKSFSCVCALFTQQ